MTAATVVAFMLGWLCGNAWRRLMARVRFQRLMEMADQSAVAASRERLEAARRAPFPYESLARSVTETPAGPVEVEVLVLPASRRKPPVS